MKSWWLESEGNVHSEVVDLVKTLCSKYSNEERYRKLMLLYGQRRFLTNNGNEVLSLRDLYHKYQKEHQMRLNVCQSVVDTMTAKVTKNRPKPMFLTSDGDIFKQKKAEEIGDWVEGMFQKTGYYEKAEKVFRDSQIFDQGFLKVYRTEEEIHVERIYPAQIIIDEQEAIYDMPRSMHYKTRVSRETLCAEYPDFENEIKYTDGGKGKDTLSEMIDVYESWHLPNKTYKEDKETGELIEELQEGRHTICINGVDLFDEEWEYDWFDIIPFYFTEPLVGFNGRGVIELISGIQLEIDKLMTRIQQSMHLMAVPRYFIQTGSKVNTSHITNIPGSFIHYTGQPPVMDTGGSVSPDVFAHLDRLYQRAFEIAGISQLSAQSRKPSGLDSGVALREYNDIETERFINVGKRYENLALEVAKRMIAYAKEIAEEKGEFPVKVKKKSHIKKLDFKKIMLDEEDYTMSVYPVSSLPSTPAGRLQTITEMINIGVIQEKDEILSLLNYPDLDKYRNLATADKDDIDRTIEEILFNGNYFPPEPFQNLQLGVQRAQSIYLKTRFDEVPEENRNLLRNWINEASAILDRSQKEALAQQQAVQMQQQSPALTPPPQPIQ